MQHNATRAILKNVDNLTQVCYNIYVTSDRCAFFVSSFFNVIIQYSAPTKAHTLLVTHNVVHKVGAVLFLRKEKTADVLADTRQFFLRSKMLLKTFCILADLYLLVNPRNQQPNTKTAGVEQC